MARRRQLDIEKDAPKIGHNSNLSEDARQKLGSFVRRIESLEEEKRSFAKDIRDAAVKRDLGAQAN